MIRLFNQSIQKIFTLRYKKFEYFSKYPVEQQEQVLKDLIRAARKTEWGIQYDFSHIHSSAEFARKVPLTDYEVLKSWIERMIAGEKNILWPGKVKWFAKSSGTTNDKSKYIPVSDESLHKCHYKASIDVFAHYIKSNPDTKILKGKNLTIGGSHKVSTLSTSTRTGDLSAVMLQNLPYLSKFLNAPSSEIALLPDFEEKIDKIIQTTINENITSFSGVPSWFLVMIKKVLEVTGKENLLEVWPNLEVFAHGGINFEPYREQYEKLIPSPNMHYMNTYNASEGFFGLQNDLNQDDLLLMLDNGIYYEFIAMDEFLKDDKKAIPLSEVETGINYAMVISTNGGLWRYVIGDTVKFTKKYPFKFKITGRTKHFINAFGEELIIDNANKGLQVACKATNAIISEYSAGPVFMNAESKGCHQWIIEFEKEPDNLENFTQILDKELQSLNSDYEAKRYKNMALTHLEVVNAPKDTFYKWMKKRGKVGGQNKIPRLANDREYLDSLLEIIEAD
ncbi:MAG: GH3 auxin-responsive promoter family protein [Prolixibacteraceae bacterium]